MFYYFLLQEYFSYPIIYSILGAFYLPRLYSKKPELFSQQKIPVLEVIVRDNLPPRLITVLLSLTHDSYRPYCFTLAEFRNHSWNLGRHDSSAQYQTHVNLMQVNYPACYIISLIPHKQFMIYIYFLVIFMKISFY